VEWLLLLFLWTEWGSFRGRELCLSQHLSLSVASNAPENGKNTSTVKSGKDGEILPLLSCLPNISREGNSEKKMGDHIFRS